MRYNNSFHTAKTQEGLKSADIATPEPYVGGIIAAEFTGRYAGFLNCSPLRHLTACRYAGALVLGSNTLTISYLGDYGADVCIAGSCA